LKEQYENLNESLAQFCQQVKGLRFADIWTPMLKANGQLMQDLFIEDDLHMNNRGYDIWKKVIEPLLTQ
jgi:lysophospholipase L1-like esterase